MEPRRTQATSSTTDGTDPPRGGAWDAPLAVAPLCFLDAEMTGADAERDVLVELALVRVVGGAVVDQFATALAADQASAPAALAMHGLDAAALAAAPRFADVAERVAALLAGAVPVAHGAALDQAVLGRALAAAGRDPGLVRHVVDTLTLARRAVPARSYSLPGLSAELGLPPRRWHRALPDALAVADLFAHLAPAFAAPTARDLWEVRVGQRDVVRVRASVAATLADLEASGARGVVVVRGRGAAPMELRVLVERYTPPHARLRLVGARGGVRIVRADRILRVSRGG